MRRLRLVLLPLFALALVSFAWGQSPTKAKSAPAKAAAAAPAQQIDINAASLSELVSIPGIGDAYANKIMTGRPYKSKAQLKSRHILPDAVYEKTKDYMVAKQK